MQPLGTKKITQTLGTTKKNHATSRDKKISRNFTGLESHTTSWDKKIMQPLRPKINHATSRDKKTCNISGQKNHATSWDKKKNHATSLKFFQDILRLSQFTLV